MIGIKQGERYNEKSINERHRDHAMFIAYAPAEAPRIALAVLVENTGTGGSTAAPIARQVFDHFLLGQSPESTSTKSAELTESVADHVHEHLQEMESEDEEILFHTLYRRLSFSRNSHIDVGRTHCAL